MRVGIIYILTNAVNGKQYVGQTIRSLESRFNSHCRGSLYPIASAIKKYGASSFSKEILYESVDRDALNFAEVELIAAYDTLVPNGYNLQSGGNSPVAHPETRAKQSAWQKGIPKGPFSPEHCAAIREVKLLDSAAAIMAMTKANTGRKMPASHLEKLSTLARTRKGIPCHDAESKAKISAGNRGKKRTDKQREALSRSLTGRKLSDTHAANIGIGHRGLKHKPSTIEKMKTARKRWHEEHGHSVRSS